MLDSSILGTYLCIEGEPMKVYDKPLVPVFFSVYSSSVLGTQLWILDVPMVLYAGP
jgi:hypothetical protein